MSTSKELDEAMRDLRGDPRGPVPMLVIRAALFCPHCGHRHVEWDGGDPAARWERRAHTTHRCARCGGDFDVFVCGSSDTELDGRPEAAADGPAATRHTDRENS